MKILNCFTGEVLMEIARKNLQDLEGADLRGADLRWANLRGANLEGADLIGANLREADLDDSDLEGADLRGADLRWVNLRWANLRGANLEGANLRGADLDYSSLYFGCVSLKAKFDNKQIIQILFHAAKPCENNKNITDPDIKKLLKTKIFQKVVNKFHRKEIDRFDIKKVK